MSMQPYLFFNGRCEEAIAFYGRTLGAQTTALMRYRDNPEPPPPGMLPPGFEDKVMHASLRIGDATLLLSDGDGGGPQFAGFSLSLVLADEDQVLRTFADLAEGGQVTMPPGRTFWSPCFGMLTDRYGVGWMVWTDRQAGTEAGAPANNPACWFEIYVQDMERAKAFYQGVFGRTLSRIDTADLELWAFDADPAAPGAAGALARMPGASSAGNSTLVYFACRDCAVEAAAAAAHGGTVVRAKMSIGKYGYIALVTDTEGNMIGLYSMT